MPFEIQSVNPDYLIYGGAAGALVGVSTFLFFLYGRIRRLVLLLKRQSPTSPPGVFKSIFRLSMIMVWTSFFGMLLFTGLFLRAFTAFTREEPVAEIRTEILGGDRAGRDFLVHLAPARSRTTRHLLLKGDQWMLEGDILKWDNWVNFLGLTSRYRLTRLRGRFVSREEEANRKPYVHSLVREEENPLWRHLYRFGTMLPLVNSVYGTAAFQYAENGRTYLVYIGNSGFVVREKGE